MYASVTSMEHELKNIEEVLSCTCSVSFPTLIFVPLVCGCRAQSHVLQVLCAGTILQTAKFRSQTGNSALTVKAAAVRLAARRFDSLILLEDGGKKHFTLTQMYQFQYCLDSWDSCVLAGLFKELNSAVSFVPGRVPVSLWKGEVLICTMQERVSQQ